MKGNMRLEGGRGEDEKNKKNMNKRKLLKPNVFDYGRESEQMRKRKGECVWKSKVICVDG